MLGYDELSSVVNVEFAEVTTAENVARAADEAAVSVAVLDVDVDLAVGLGDVGNDQNSGGHGGTIMQLTERLAFSQRFQSSADRR